MNNVCSADVDLSPYSFTRGKTNVTDLLEAQAIALQARTLQTFPGEMISEIQKADEIVFFTSPGLVRRGGLTMDEMIYIQSNPAERAKTIFVPGMFNGLPGVK